MTASTKSTNTSFSRNQTSLNELLQYVRESLIPVLHDFEKGYEDTSDFDYHLEMLNTSISNYLTERSFL